MQVEKHESYAIIRMPDFVDVTNVQEFKQVLQSLYEHGYSTIKLDCSCLQRIDCAGLGSLVVYQKKLKQRGNKLKIVNVTHNYIKQIFHKIELRRVISIEEITLIESERQKLNCMDIKDLGILEQSQRVDRLVYKEMEESEK